MPSEPAEWQTQLRAAIVAAFGSVKGYAKHLAGEGAEAAKVESQRRGIQKWLQLDHPTVPSVASVTRMLQDGVEVDPASFPRGQDRPRPYTTAELGELVEHAIGLLEGVSVNQAAVLGVVEDAGETIRGLGTEIGSLRDELRRLGSSSQRRRRAS